MKKGTARLASSPFSCRMRRCGLFGRLRRRGAGAAGALLGRLLAGFAVIVGPRDRGRQDRHVQTLGRFGGCRFDDLARTATARTGRFFALRRGCLLDGCSLYDRRCDRSRRGLFDLRLRFGKDGTVATRTVTARAAIFTATIVATTILATIA